MDKNPGHVLTADSEISDRNTALNLNVYIKYNDIKSVLYNFSLSVSNIPFSLHLVYAFLHCV